MVNYVKRYRMEISLRCWEPPAARSPRRYGFVAWHPDLIAAHADAKYRSFRGEIDASVFPCLGDPIGCRRLMEDIAARLGFCREATWLIQAGDFIDGEPEYCGTIQGVRDGFDMGGIQNLGIVPEHRGRGLGTALLCQSLVGFRLAGLRRVYLEVTAHNYGAVRLYHQLGFRTTKTVYKAVESPIVTGMAE